MTRTVIYETPENREEYADVPCEYASDALHGEAHGGVYRCGVLLHYHDETQFGHNSWRIYREQSTATKAP